MASKLAYILNMCLYININKLLFNHKYFVFDFSWNLTIYLDLKLILLLIHCNDF